MTTNHTSTIPAADILVVDDTITSLKLLTDILTQAGYRVRPADGPHVALESALAHPPSLILLDVRMPGMSGFEVCRQLKQDERTGEIPVIFVSALQDVDDRVQGFEAGGVDFVTKPFEESEVLARVKTHLQLRTLQLYLEALVAERTVELIEANQGLRKEIAERKRAEQELQASQRLLSLVIDNIPAQVAYVDKHQHYRFVNQRYEQVYGCPHSQFVGKHVLEILGPKGYAAAEQHIAAVLAGDEVSYEADFYYPDSGPRWMSIDYVPDRDHAGDVQGFIGLITDITERKQGERQLQAYQQKLKALAAELTLVEERERRRIAADLHDEVSQTLALARIKLATARKATSEAKVAAIVDDVSGTIRQAIRDTRDLVFDLSSPLLNEIGLAAALTEWLEELVEKKHGLQTEFIEAGQNIMLDEDVRAILFRNVRELLTNVIRHAQASKVRVRLERAGDTATVVVQDDGIGFDPLAASEATSRARGFGLFSVRERMLDLGGTLEIVSAPGQGCTAILIAPLSHG